MGLKPVGVAREAAEMGEASQEQAVGEAVPRGIVDQPQPKGSALTRTGYGAFAAASACMSTAMR